MSFKILVIKHINYVLKFPKLETFYQSTNTTESLKIIF